MCYAKPGPRCSNHTEKEVVAALENVREFFVKWGAKNVSDLPPHVRKVYDEKIMPEVRKASRDYDSTPKGITRLKEKLKERLEQDALGRDPFEGETAQSLREQVERAETHRRIRTNMLALVKEAQEEATQMDEIPRQVNVMQQWSKAEIIRRMGNEPSAEKFYTARDELIAQNGETITFFKKKMNDEINRMDATVDNFVGAAPINAKRHIRSAYAGLAVGEQTETYLKGLSFAG